MSGIEVGVLVVVCGGMLAFMASLIVLSSRGPHHDTTRGVWYGQAAE